MDIELKIQISEIVSKIKSKLFVDALKLSTEALKKNPTEINLLNLSGTINLNLENWNEALEYFNKAIKIKENIPEIYNNIGIVYMNLDKNNLAIKNFEKSISLDKKNILTYVNLGKSLESIGDYEKAIKIYKEAMNLSPQNLEVNSNLIKMLNYYLPKENYGLKIFKANDEIKKIKINCTLDLKIEDVVVKNFFNDSNKLVNDNLQLKNYSEIELYSKNEIKYGCVRHFKIFNKFNVIPEFCFNCFKVEVHPKNIVDLIKLYFLFDKLKLPENNNRKCTIEIRPNIGGSFKGLVYCLSLEDLKNTYSVVNEKVKSMIDEKIEIIAKRGCAEYAQANPDYKKVNFNGDQKVNYDKKFKEKENLIDQKFNFLQNKAKKINLPGNKIGNVMIIRNWLFYAKMIGDQSYKKITTDEINSKYLEKILSNQLSYRKDQFNKINN